MKSLDAILSSSGLRREGRNEEREVNVEGDDVRNVNWFPRQAALWLAALSAIGVLPSAEADTTGANEISSLTEIVVTAEKRSERAQDVPASLEVLSADNLQEQGLTQLADYAKLVPGMTLFGNSSPGQGQIVLRGITSGTFAAPLVGTYLDDVPLSPSSPNSLAVGYSFDPDLAEVERIEVLEGPQSTLYGANSMGGVVKYVTKQPDLNNIDGRVNISGVKVDGGGSGYGVRASVNVPLIPDSVALRSTVFYRDDPGFVNNTFYGERKANDDSVKGVRLSLLIKFSDVLETTVSAIEQHIDTRNPDQIYINPTTMRPSLPGLAYSSAVAQPITIKNQSISDTTTLNLPFAVLTNIASYADILGNATTDTSVAAPPGFTASSFGPTESKRLSDELRLVASPGRVEWLVGGFYTHENDPDALFVLGGDAAGTTLPPSSPNYNIYSYHNTSLFTEKAVFGDITYHFTDQISATTGARYSSNEQSFHYSGTGILAGPAGLGGQGDSRDSATTYLATVTYKPVSNLTFYGRAASAYRPGGPNILTPMQVAAGAPTIFGPDKLWDYETGFKGTAWNQRISYSADIFYMSWTDIQLVTFIDSFIIIANASSARSNGAEGSFQITPVDHLNVSLSAAYIDAKLTSSVAAIGAISGNPLPYSPKFSAAAVADYRFRSIDGVVPTAGVTYAYRGSSTTNLDEGTAYTLPSYGTLDIRGGIEWLRYSLLASVQNLTNEYGLTNAGFSNAVGTPTPTFGTVIRPRTFGLQFAAKF